MSSSYICYIAGKSGGHILPALTHAQRFLKNNPYHKLIFFSTRSALDIQLLTTNSSVDDHRPLPIQEVPHRQYWRYPFFAVCLALSFCISLWTLLRYRPEKIVSMGGVVSVPVCLAAWLLWIPIEMYELNVEPGAAVKLLSKLATTTYICFEDTRQLLSSNVRCMHAPYPLRYTGRDKLNKHDARKRLGLSVDKEVICIVGGSQGSSFFNNFMKNHAAANIDSAKYAIIHQTGNHHADVKRVYNQYGIESLVFKYRPDMHVCLSAADIVVTRGGAGVLFELLFFGKSAIVVPLEISSTAHQLYNARAIVRKSPHRFKLFRQRELEAHPASVYNALLYFHKQHQS